MKEKTKLPVVNKELKELADNIKSTYFQYFHKMPLCFEMHNKLISLRNSISSGKIPNELTTVEQIMSELGEIQAQMVKIVADFEKLNAKNIVELSKYTKSKTAFIKSFLKLSKDNQKKLLFLAEVDIHEEIVVLNKALEDHFVNDKNGQKEIQQLINYVSNNVERYQKYIEQKTVANSI